MTCHQGRSSGPAVDAAIAAAAPATDDTVSAALNFQNIHFFPAAATLYAGRAKGGYQYAGPGLRRPLPPRRRLRHLHRLPRPAHDAGQVRRLRRLPHRRHRRRRRARDPDDVVGRHRLRRRRQHQRGDLRRARRPARQAGHGDPDLRFGARHADLLRRRQLSLLVRRRRRRRQLLGRRGGDRQRVRQLDRRACCAPPTTTRWPARIRARSPTTRSTSSSCSTTRSPTSTARWSAKVDMSKATRTDFGHFNGASEAARHWDQDEQVDATCSSCHGGEDGFRFYVQYHARPGGPGDRQRPRMRHLPRQARHRLHGDHRGARR